MGSRVSTIWYVDTDDPLSVLREHPQPDIEAAEALAGTLHPDLEVSLTGRSTLSSAAAVTDGEIVFIGAYPGLTVVCSADLAVPRPSTLPERWIQARTCARTYYVASRPDIEWGAFSMWENGTLTRSFSATPVHIHEDVGLPLVWEKPFWAGDFPLQHPPGLLPDPQSLPFDPGMFAEGANLEWLGFRYSDATADTAVDIGVLSLHRFAIHPPGEGPVEEAAEAAAEPAETESVPTVPPAPPSPPRKLGRLRRYFGF